MSAFEGYKQLLIGGLSGNSLVGLNFQSRWSQTDVNLYSQFCSPPQQLFPKTTSHWHPPFPPAPCSRPLFFKIDLVFVVLIRLSLPEGPREQPQRNTAWKDRTHNPCYQGGCHLACRSTNSFNTMGAIIHLNIDMISCIPISVSLALAKRLHLFQGNTMSAHTPASFLDLQMRRCFAGE